MATGLAVADANAFLEWLFNGTAMPAASANLWIQLHIGDPGPAGTANIAGNATRKDLTAAMGTAAAGAITNTAQLAWTISEVDSSEDYTHVSYHTASTAGTFKGSGLMTANAVIIGDEFIIPVGDLDGSFLVAA